MMRAASGCRSLALLLALAAAAAATAAPAAAPAAFPSTLAGTGPAGICACAANTYDSAACVASTKALCAKPDSKASSFCANMASLPKLASNQSAAADVSWFLSANCKPPSTTSMDTCACFEAPTSDACALARYKLCSQGDSLCAGLTLGSTASLEQVAYARRYQNSTCAQQSPMSVDMLFPGISQADFDRLYASKTGGALASITGLPAAAVTYTAAAAGKTAAAAANATVPANASAPANATLKEVPALTEEVPALTEVVPAVETTPAGVAAAAATTAAVAAAKPKQPAPAPKPAPVVEEVEVLEEVPVAVETLQPEAPAAAAKPAPKPVAPVVAPEPAPKEEPPKEEPKPAAKPPAKEAAKPAPAKDQGAEEWDGAPDCSYKLTSSNYIKDKTGRMWGFDDGTGTSCAFKSQSLPAAAKGGRRMLLQAPAPAPAISSGGTGAFATARYSIATTQPATTRARLLGSAANDGSGLYQALSAAGVPYKPSMSVSGVQVVSGDVPDSMTSRSSSGDQLGVYDASLLAPQKAPEPAAPAPSSSTAGTGLSLGALIGIIVGSAVAGLLLVGLLIWCCCCKGRGKSHKKADTSSGTGAAKGGSIAAGAGAGCAVAATAAAAHHHSADDDKHLHGSKVANGTAALAADTDAPSDQAAGGRMLGTPVAVPSTPTGQHYPQVQPSTPTGASAAGQQQEQALRSQLQRLETKRA